MSCADEAWWPTGAGLSLVMPFLLSGLGTPLFLPFAYLEQMAVGVAEKTADLSSPQSYGGRKNSAPRDPRTSYAARQSGIRIGVPRCRVAHPCAASFLSRLAASRPSISAV